MIVLGGWYFTIGFGVIVFLGQLEIFELVHAKGNFARCQNHPGGQPNFVDYRPCFSHFGRCAVAVGRYLHLLLSAISASGCDYRRCCGFYPGIVLRRLPPQFLDSSSGLGRFLDRYVTPGRLLAGWAVARLGDHPGGAFADPAGLWLYLGLRHRRLYRRQMVGAHPPLSNISPKKTVEGAVCGMVASMAVALYGSHALGWPIWIVTGAGFGLMVGTSSLLGDLTESLMKRDAGVKDSGVLIPGHGGILDRTDSYVFTGALVYYFVTLLLPALPG